MRIISTKQSDDTVPLIQRGSPALEVTGGLMRTRRMATVAVVDSSGIAFALERHAFDKSAFMRFVRVSIAIIAGRAILVVSAFTPLQLSPCISLDGLIQDDSREA